MAVAGPAGVAFRGGGRPPEADSPPTARRTRGLETPPLPPGDCTLPSRPQQPRGGEPVGLQARRGPLPQTAISPNECYHSMTRPSGHPTPRLYDRSRATTTATEDAPRRVLAAPVDARSQQGCVASRCARPSERPSHTCFTPARVASRAVPVAPAGSTPCRDETTAGSNTPCAPRPPPFEVACETREARAFRPGTSGGWVGLRS